MGKEEAHGMEAEESLFNHMKIYSFSLNEAVQYKPQDFSVKQVYT